MTALLANSLVDGYLISNGIGRGIVIAQLIGSVVMFTALFGKFREMLALGSAARRFLRDFTSSGDTLDYYFQQRPVFARGVEAIYRDTVERLLRIIPSDKRLRMPAAGGEAGESTALTELELELVAGSCEQRLEIEKGLLRHGTGLVVTIVALSPMLGLLGTVWGVLDAFAEMGSAGSANLATIAPSISSALVTTVVGLLVAIPGQLLLDAINARFETLKREMDAFAEELLNRLSCEYQERNR